MFTQIKNRTAVNLIIGSLGAGKTTLLKNLLKHKPENENWGILVNEFGAIGIDGAILSNQNDTIQVKQIPGGCICCTALGEFKEAIQTLNSQYRLDRIFIEPTGLGEPESMVELLHTPYFQENFEIQTVFAVLDSAITKVEQFSQLVIMQNLVDVADVIVFNKQDRAVEANIEALNHFANQLYPPKLAIINTQHAQIDPQLISITSNRHRQPPATQYLKTDDVETKPVHNSEPPALPELPPPHERLQGLLERKSQNQLNTVSIGWIFNNETVFDWNKLLKLFKSLANGKTTEKYPLRAKGVFKVGEPRMLFQWVKDQEVTREYIAYRRDSRLEILLPHGNDFDLMQFEKKLAACQK